jgi:hypothetical protein
MADFIRMFLLESALPKSRSATSVSDGEPEQFSIGPDFKQDLVRKSPQHASAEIARADVVLGTAETFRGCFNLLDNMRVAIRLSAMGESRVDAAGRLCYPPRRFRAKNPQAMLEVRR